MRKSVLLISVLMLTSACSVKKIAVNNMADIINCAMPVYLAEEDIQTAKETMLPAVKMSESLLASQPQNSKLLELTAKGYCGYSFAFLEDVDNNRSSAMYAKGLGFSTKLLENKKILSGGKFNSQNVKIKDTSSVFWHTFCLAGFVKLNLDKPAALSKISKLEEMIDVVIKLNPSYYYNAAYALKASLLARSKILGGNLSLAKHYFDMSLKGEGDKFKVNRLLYAKTYAPAVLDRNLFEKLLGEVISSPDELPKEALLNKISVQKAHKLLEQTDEIF